jgi:hypothetical protein
MAVKAWIAAHRKLIVAVTGAALTLAIQVWGTGNVWVSFAVLAATSLGVYGAPNQAAAAGGPAGLPGISTLGLPATAMPPVPPEKTLIQPPAAPE